MCTGTPLTRCASLRPYVSTQLSFGLQVGRPTEQAVAAKPTGSPSRRGDAPAEQRSTILFMPGDFQAQGAPLQSPVLGSSIP